jgi:hypothetical protein
MIYTHGAVSPQRQREDDRHALNVYYDDLTRQGLIPRVQIDQARNAALAVVDQVFQARDAFDNADHRNSVSTADGVLTRRGNQEVLIRHPLYGSSTNTRWEMVQVPDGSIAAARAREVMKRNLGWSDQ